MLATFDGEQRVGCWRVTTAPRATSDELRMLWRGLLRDTVVTGVAACSTVPALLPALRELLDSLEVPVVLIGPGVRTGVPLHVDNPREVGMGSLKQPARSQRGLQFTLKGLLWAVLIMSLLCGFLRACEFDRLVLALLVLLFGAALMDRPIQHKVRQVAQDRGTAAATLTNALLNLAALLALLWAAALVLLV